MLTVRAGERLALNFTVSRNPAAKGVYASRLMLRQIISIYETWASTFAHSPEVAHKLAHADSTHLRHGVMFTEAMERTATVEHLEAVQQSERERQWREIERGCGAELWLRDGDEDGPHTDMTSDAEGVQHVTVNASVCVAFALAGSRTDADIYGGSQVQLQAARLRDDFPHLRLPTQDQTPRPLREPRFGGRW